jgi:hypothetical protein
MYGLHVAVTGAGQLPLPSQFAAAVCLLVVVSHAAERHEVVFGA